MAITTSRAILAPTLCLSLTLSGPALAGVPSTQLNVAMAPAEGEATDGEAEAEPEPEVDPEAEKKAKGLYTQAEKLAKKKKWTDAVKLYEEAYYLVPGKHGFAHKVGYAAFQAKDCDKALQYMLHFLTYAEGEQYEGKRQEARDILTQMLEQGCVTEEQLGNAHLSEEQKEEKARELYEQAEALAAELKWSEAVVLYEQAYMLVPSKVGFAHKVGLAAYEAKDCDKAHQYLVFFVDYADPNKFADRRAEATKLVRELERSGCVSGTEMQEHQLENPFEINPDENRKQDTNKKTSGPKGLLIGGSVMLVLGLGGIGVGVAGMVLAGSSQSKLDALASTDTASGYPDGDYACRDVGADACPPTLEDQISNRKLMGIVGLGAGGGLLVVGAVLIAVHAVKNKKGGGKQARLDSVAPVYMPGGFGAAASLRF